MREFIDGFADSSTFRKETITMTTDFTSATDAAEHEVRNLLIDRAREVAALIDAEADETEQGGKVTGKAVAAIREQGLFWAGIPEAAGGSGGSTIDAIEVVEELSRADASAGWIAMVNISAAGMIAGYMPEAGASQLYSPTTQSMVAGFAAPVGKGEKVDGGYILSGRWTFASGSDWADWFGLGFTVVDADGAPLLDDKGARQALYAVLPSTSGDIVRNWDVTGLAGTGSHDIDVTKVFVPDDRIMDAYSLDPVRPESVFALGKDGIAVAGHAGVALGIMKRALQEVAEITEGKGRRGYPGPVDEYPVFLFEFAKADAQYHSARAYLLETYRAAEAQAIQEGQISTELRARMRHAAVWVHRVMEEVVAFARLWGGTQAFRNPSVLGRVVRDANVAAQHLHVDNIWLVDVARELVATAKKR
ncbi:acyl-CoA dehydrogenase family protein [Gordonia sp. ABSL11-1]|uniref:acyl-CoA dehydrogenase family protein n=1 Tax=Gordonia sp. ABSL11-1 TaxID=3053924 RepID=UPI002572227C|nr:acyl-CoA dehydrogenase family protein [Gordonia sp. ABSL11-1]MDL9948626.1 acyl-CoA dehydrogenase family protein [Gordonia sp. ABSL11-1]